MPLRGGTMEVRSFKTTTAIYTTSVQPSAAQLNCTCQCFPVLEQLQSFPDFSVELRHSKYDIIVGNRTETKSKGESELLGP